MQTAVQPETMLRPRLGIVVSTWSHEDGADYARQLVNLLPAYIPGVIDASICPRLLEHEKDIPIIADFFSGQNLDALLIIPGNFTLDHVMPLLAQRLGIPTVLWGMTTREAWGAFVGVQQTFYPFKELRLHYRAVIGDLNDERAWRKVLSYARAAAIIKRLKGLRVGLMGWRAEGMSDVTFDELTLRETFGVQVVNVGLSRYERTISTIGADEAETAWDKLDSAFDTSSINKDVIRFGVQSYLAMQKITNEEDLQAITVECFHDHLGGPCLGCSLSNDRGIAASCESDVPGAVMMAIGQLLTGQPAFHADIIVAQLEQNSAIWHHCGNMPTTLAGESKLKLRPIPEHIGPGAFGPTIQATMKSGPVTALNLVGRRGNIRIAALEGRSVPYELEFPGSAARVVYTFNLAEALEILGNSGYGHHFALVQGHIGQDIHEFCQLLGIDYIQF